MRHILGFIGLTDVTFIHAENQSRPDLAEASRAVALRQIGEATKQPIEKWPGTVAATEISSPALSANYATKGANKNVHFTSVSGFASTQAHHR